MKKTQELVSERTDKDPLRPGFLDAYKAIQDQANSMAWEIGNHLGEVVNAICDVFGVKHPETIYFDGAEEGDIGIPKCYSDSISYVFYVHSGPSPDISTSYYDYGSEIPKDYMYMTLDEVKADVQRQIDEDNKKKEERKAKRAKASAKKKALIDAAASKLTKAERKALGL